MWNLVKTENSGLDLFPYCCLSTIKFEILFIQIIFQLKNIEVNELGGRWLCLGQFL